MFYHLTFLILGWTVFQNLKDLRQSLFRLYSVILVFFCFLTVFAWLYLFPNEFRRYCEELFVSLFLMNTDSGNESRNMLYHFWIVSLGFRFSVVWGSLFYLLKKKRKIFLIMTAFLIFSSAVMELKGFHQPFLRYSWSFLLGGHLAFVIDRHFSIAPKVRNFVFISFLWAWPFWVYARLVNFYPEGLSGLKLGATFLFIVFLTWLLSFKFVLLRHFRIAVYLFLSLILIAEKGGTFELMSLNSFRLFENVHGEKISNEMEDHYENYLKTGEGEKRIVFLGDSNLQMLTSYLMELNAGPSLEFHFVYGSFQSEKSSRLAFDKATEKVVLIYSWENTEGLESFIKKLYKNGKEVIIVGSLPSGNELKPHSVIQRSFWKPVPELKQQYFDVGKFQQEHGKIQAELLKIVNESKGRFIDPIPYLCISEKCPLLNENLEPLFLNSHYIRPHILGHRARFLDQIITEAP